MKPAQPDQAQKRAPEPGSGKAASKVPPVAPPAPGVSELRRQLAKKQWPKPADVPLGEMLKEAPPDFADTAPEAPLAAEIEIAPSPWKPEKQIARVTLKAKATKPPSRPRANLVFAIDVSQSMAGPNRLPLAQEGIRLLADRLKPEDRVAVVTYAAKAVEALPGGPLGEKGLELRNCLTGLEAAGRTNGYEGLRLAYAAARKGRVETGLNVVVLCTDGNFNLGETDDAVLGALVAQAAAEGIKLSVFGFGRSDRNDERLELLATKGGGRSCYVNTREEAERLLAGQVDGLVEAVAHEVTLDVKFNPQRVAEVERLDGGTEDGASAPVEELLPGRSMGALYEVTLKPGQPSAGPLADLVANYRRPGSMAPERLQEALSATPENWEHTRAGFRFATAWAEFGRILQGPPAHAGDDLDRLEAWVQRALADEAGGYRQELLENIAQARLAAATAGADGK
jgi:Ca-activated chloride channel family protein